MSANTVFCHVLRDNVTLVTDSQGDITKISCPSLNTASHVCEIKANGQSFLKLNALILSDTTLGTREIICDFGNPRTARENIEKFIGK